MRISNVDALEMVQFVVARIDALAEDLHKASGDWPEWAALTESRRKELRRCASYLLARYEINPKPKQ